MATETESEALARTRVAIVGAGFSGLYMAKQCQDLGVSFTVFEKADEVGGTWRENRYPGLFIDLPYRDYHYPFLPKHDFSGAFASGPELQQYIVTAADEFQLRPHIRFGTEIARLTWLGDRWELVTTDGEHIEAEVVVAATGFLRCPSIPRIEGASEFAGPMFHSSEWPEDFALEGRRYGIIGNGSSGIQILSALAYLDCEVTQFIRTPQWIEICPNPKLTDELRTELAEHPERGPEITERLRLQVGQDPRLTDLRWRTRPGPLRAAAADALREDLLEIADPELRALMTPDYEPGCKRIPKSVHYFDAIGRDNVTIVRGQVERITAHSVVMSDGREVEVDVIVWATGFDAHAYLRPIEVIGAEGHRLDEVWADGPFSYRGVAIPGFPNFFLLHGPYSPVNIVPLPYTLDHATTYIGQLVRRVAQEGLSFAPSEAATERFMQRVADAIPDTIWASGCSNWFQVGGRAVLWPFAEPEHREMFAQLALDELDIAPLNRVVDADRTPQPAG